MARAPGCLTTVMTWTTNDDFPPCWQDAGDTAPLEHMAFQKSRADDLWTHHWLGSWIVGWRTGSKSKSLPKSSLLAQQTTTAILLCDLVEHFVSWRQCDNDDEVIWWWCRWCRWWCLSAGGSFLVYTNYKPQSHDSGWKSCVCLTQSVEKESSTIHHDSTIEKCSYQTVLRESSSVDGGWI